MNSEWLYYKDPNIGVYARPQSDGWVALKTHGVGTTHTLYVHPTGKRAYIETAHLGPTFALLLLVPAFGGILAAMLELWGVPGTLATGLGFGLPVIPAAPVAWYTATGRYGTRDTMEEALTELVTKVQEHEHRKMAAQHAVQDARALVDAHKDTARALEDVDRMLDNTQGDGAS